MTGLLGVLFLFGGLFSGCSQSHPLVLLFDNQIEGMPSIRFNYNIQADGAPYLERNFTISADSPGVWLGDTLNLSEGLINLDCFAMHPTVEGAGELLIDRKFIEIDHQKAGFLLISVEQIPGDSLGMIAFYISDVLPTALVSTIRPVTP